MDARTQQQYAETFHDLHRKRDPLVLFNAWDVATAKAIAKTSPVVATSSGAVASALGYADGENVPFDLLAGLVSRMNSMLRRSKQCGTLRRNSEFICSSMRELTRFC
jgi:2-methylisocitrate lyase-like PEP mutase family enzyme